MYLAAISSKCFLTSYEALARLICFLFGLGCQKPLKILEREFCIHRNKPLPHADDGVYFSAASKRKLQREMVFGKNLPQQFGEKQFADPAPQFRRTQNILQRSDVFTDVHHRLS